MDRVTTRSVSARKLFLAPIPSLPFTEITVPESRDTRMNDPSVNWNRKVSFVGIERFPLRGWGRPPSLGTGALDSMELW